MRINDELHKLRTAEPLERQQTEIFLEGTASVAAVLIIVLGLLEFFHVINDSAIYLLLLSLGLVMNLLAALRNYIKGNRIFFWLETAADIVIAIGILYLLFI